MSTHDTIFLPYSPVRRPAYLRLWLGQATSRLGDQLAVIALLGFVLHLTGPGVAVGLVVMRFELPALMAGPLFGGLLDRLRPRVPMSIDNLLGTFVIALVPALRALSMLHAAWTPANGDGMP